MHVILHIEFGGTKFIKRCLVQLIVKVKWINWAWEGEDVITQNQAFAHPLSSEHLESHSFTAQLCFTLSFSLVQFSCVPKSLPPPHPCFSVEGAYGKKSYRVLAFRRDKSKALYYCQLEWPSRDKF